MSYPGGITATPTPKPSRKRKGPSPSSEPLISSSSLSRSSSSTSSALSSSSSSASSSSSDLRSTGGPDHQELNEIFKDIGRRIADLPAGKAPTAELDPEQFERFQEWIGSPPDDFDDQYRALDRGTDEAVSTASVKALITGISKQLSARTSSSAEEQRSAIARWLVGVSGLRLPTAYTGRAAKHEKQEERDRAKGKTVKKGERAFSTAQHPTSRKAGTWSTGAPGAGTLDLERRQVVARATESALQEGDATIESVFRAMIRTAGKATLNVFVAPATASNVRPRVREVRTQAQAAARERFKSHTVEWGGAQIRGRSPQRWDAPWRPTDYERDLSPERSDLAASSSSAWSSSTSLTSSSSSSSSSSTDLLRLAFPSSYSSSSLSSSSAAATSSPSTDLLSSSSSSPSPMLDVAPL